MIKFIDLGKILLVKNDENKNFRFDISFLRVLAIFAVVFYHFNIFPIRSGFVGVDIFFVISGFLMTKIILTGFDKDSFELLGFYKKRVVRIFPALLVLLIIFCLVVYIFVPIQFIKYLQSTYSSSLFFSNILYYLNNGYFSSDSHNNFLLHTWSLSVEWQFYMIYPLILILLKKIYCFKKELFLNVFLGLIIVSFLSMLYYSKTDNEFSFYMFFNRAWEMLFGGLALFYEKKIEIIKDNIKILISVFSFFTLAVCLVFCDSQSWPSYITIIPVFFTTLIIALNLNFYFFNNKLFKYLGDVSYSLYLYHWPIYVLSMFLGYNKGLFNISILILISLVLAILSYEVIEKKNVFKNVKFIILLSLFIFTVTFYFSKMDANRYSKEYGNLINVTTHYKDKNAKKQYGKHFDGEQDFKDFDLSFLKVKDNKKNIVLLGDSHAGMFAQTFENILSKKDINFIQITADATYPMINSKGFYKGPVDYFNYAFKDFLFKNKDKIDLIIISSNYAAYSKDELEKMLNFTNRYFDRMNIKYLYLGQTQNYPIEFPTYFYMKNKHGVSFPSTRKVFDNTTNINKYLNNKLGKNYIDLLHHNVEIVSKNNYPYVYDNNHLTFYGTELYREIISDKIYSIL